jgi:hypothetical protein
MWGSTFILCSSGLLRRAAIPEDYGRMFLRNVSIEAEDFAAEQPRRPKSRSKSLGKP